MVGRCDDAQVAAEHSDLITEVPSGQGTIESDLHCSGQFDARCPGCPVLGRSFVDLEGSEDGTPDRCCHRSSSCDLEHLIEERTARTSCEHHEFRGAH